MYFKLEMLHPPKRSVCCSSLDMGQTLQLALEGLLFPRATQPCWAQRTAFPSRAGCRCPAVWSKNQIFWKPGACGTALRSRSARCAQSRSALASNISPYVQSIISKSIPLV